MNIGKAAATVAGGFVLQLSGLCLIHRVWLKEDYADTSFLWRDQACMNQRMWATLLGTLLYLICLVILYSRGVENKSWVLQGIRFGLLISVINIVYTSLASWTTLLIPHNMILGWIIGESALCIFLSLFIAALLQPKTLPTT